MHVTGEVSKDIAYPSYPTGPGVGILLLVSWRIIYDERADTGLN